MKQLKFGDKVNLQAWGTGVIVKVNKARKWTYYMIVFEDAELSGNDFKDDLIEYVEFREDKLLNN